MASHNTHLTLLLIVLIALLFLASNLKSFKAAKIIIPHQQPKITIDFIKSSCSCTTYSDLYFNSVFSNASTIQSNHVQLTHTALSVSLDGTGSMSTVIKQMTSAHGVTRMTPRVWATMKDCIETARDSMIELQNSMAMMGHLGGKDMGLQLSTMQNWVSATFTNEDTCIEGFNGSDTDDNVKDVIMCYGACRECSAADEQRLGSHQSPHFSLPIILSLIIQMS